MKGNQWCKAELSKWFTKCVCPHCSMWAWCCLEPRNWKEKDPIWISSAHVCYSGWFPPSGMRRLTCVFTKMSSEMLTPGKKHIYQNLLLCFCLLAACLSTRYWWSTPSISEEKSKQTNKNDSNQAFHIHLFSEKKLLDFRHVSKEFTLYYNLLI